MSKVLIPESVSIYTPKGFVREQSDILKNAAGVTIEPPTLGQRGFGRILVKWKYPRLRHRRIAAKPAPPKMAAHAK